MSEQRMTVLKYEDNVILTRYKWPDDPHPEANVIQNPRELLGQLEDLVWRSGKGFCPECGQRIRRK